MRDVALRWSDCRRHSESYGELTLEGLTGQDNCGATLLTCARKRMATRLFHAHERRRVTGGYLRSQGQVVPRTSGEGQH